MEQTVYLNGDFMPLHKATISVMDRGFLFGDAVYEVIPVYKGQPFQIKKHLERLLNSMRCIRLESPYSIDEWVHIIETLLEKTHITPLMMVYLQVTRGAPEVRSHTFDGDLTPTVFIKCDAVSTEHHDEGATAITVQELRWGRCDIKTTNLLANTLMQQRAKDAGAIEAIILKEGRVIEGTSSNVFIVKEGCVKTPALSEGLLNGVTRQCIVDLATKQGISIEETTLLESDLYDADEVWLTGSRKEIVPIISIDGTVIGEGQPGPLFQKMIQWYRERISHLTT